MRSESEVSWVRVKNNVGQATRVSDWHALIPGLGSMTVPPGTACGVGLTGSRQTISHSGLRNIDGKKHEACILMARDWLKGIDPTPGPLREPDPEPELAPPGSQP